MIRQARALVTGCLLESEHIGLHEAVYQVHRSLMLFIITTGPEQGLGAHDNLIGGISLYKLMTEAS